MDQADTARTSEEGDAAADKADDLNGIGNVCDSSADGNEDDEEKRFRMSIGSTGLPRQAVVPAGSAAQAGSSPGRRAVGASRASNARPRLV